MQAHSAVMCESGRLGFQHHVSELLEQIRAIVRASRRLGMILHAKRWQFSVTHAFDRVIVQITVRHFQIRWQRIFGHRKAVILRSDFHFACVQILHRLIGAAVAEFEFERFCPAG